MNFSGLEKYFDVVGKDALLIILGDVGLNLENTDENNIPVYEILTTVG